MKIYYLFCGAIICMGLCACESMGWSGHVARDTLTPGAHADTKVRTWDEDGKPHEKSVQSDPAFLYDAEQKKVQE